MRACENDADCATDYANRAANRVDGYLVQRRYQILVNAQLMHSWTLARLREGRQGICPGPSNRTQPATVIPTLRVQNA
jgi:hypothetical protein